MSNVSATMTNCPNEETLAAFIDGRLKQDARNELIHHIAGCAECRDVMTAARELESETMLESENVREFHPRRSYIPAAVAAIAATIMVVVFVPQVRDWVSLQVRGPLAPVKTAYESGPDRRVEPRLSGFPYKEFKGPTRGTPEDAEWSMMAAAAKLEETASKRSWKELRALAVAKLLIGERDDAVGAIELAGKAGGDSDPGFLNDAAAVYIERARYSQRPEDRTRAVKAAERAWARVATPESAWNRALAYEMNDRTADAIGAWNDYLAIDRDSAWRTEAQNRLRDLQER